MNDDAHFLGSGWHFPPTFDWRERSTRRVASEEDIAQALHILLSTEPGERVMQPAFGCALRHLVFEPLGPALEGELRRAIEHAVLMFEPRVRLGAIHVHADAEQAGRLWIRLDYTVIVTNTRTNLVYPYYLREATDVTTLP